MTTPADTPATPAGPQDSPEKLHGRGFIVPLVIGTAMLLQNMNAMMMANALPSIGLALAVNPLRLNLAITLYLLASAVFLPISGWAADKWGAKRIFIVAMCVFASAALACGAAQNLGQLLAARFVQGIGAAMMMPVGRLVLLRTTPKTQLVAALSLINVPALLGPMLGPIVGGAIVTYWNWRWVFLFNLPFGAAGLFLVWKYVPNVREYAVLDFDWLGLVLMGIGLTGLIVGFEYIGHPETSIVVGMAALAAGGGSILMYVRHERRAAHAIIDFSVFRLQTFRASILGASLMRFAMMSTPFLMAMFLQVGFGFTAFEAGAFALMSSIGTLFMRTMGPALLRRFGFKPILLVTSVLGAFSMAVYGLYQPSIPYGVVGAVLVTTGFIRALQLTAFTGLAYAEVDDKDMSRASTVASLAQQFLQSMALGVAGMLLNLLVHAFGETHMTARTVAPTFWIMGAIALCATFVVIPLPKDAGASLHAKPKKARTGI